MARYLHASLVLLLALGAAAFAAIGPAAAGPEAQLTASANGEPLRMTNSKDGVAVLTATGMLPGEAPKAGSVTITNSGSLDGDFSLSQKNLTDLRGPNGGALSSVLDLRIDELPSSGAPINRYGGKLAAMGKVSLGEIRKRTGRTYLVTISLPDGGRPASNTTGDNRFNGSAATTDLVWTQTKANGNGPKDKVEVKGTSTSGSTGTGSTGGSSALSTAATGASAMPAAAAGTPAKAGVTRASTAKGAGTAAGAAAASSATDTADGASRPALLAGGLGLALAGAGGFLLRRRRPQ